MWTAIKDLSKIVYFGLVTAGKFVQESLKEEIELGREFARMRRKEMNNQDGKDYTLSLDEAMKILNVQNLDPKIIRKHYENLYWANAKWRGGSFYLQSKVVRARERLELEIKNRQNSLDATR